MVLVILWVVLSIIVASMGSDRDIGGAASFFISLFFSPIIGFLVVIASDKRQPTNKEQYQRLVKQADIEKFKGNADKAIDLFKEALYYAEQEKLLTRGSLSKQAIENSIEQVQNKIREIEVTKPTQ